MRSTSRSQAYFRSLQERNLHYVVEIEVFLARAFNFNATEGDDDTSYALHFIYLDFELTCFPAHLTA